MFFLKEEQKAGVPAEKIQKHRNVQRKQTFTVIKEKQAKLSFDWRKNLKRAISFIYYESSILAQDERWRRA